MENYEVLQHGLVTYDQFLVRGNLLTNKLMSQGFQLSRLQAVFANFMVITTILFAHITFLWATCCLICFLPIIKPFFTHWYWLRVVPFIQSGNRAHGGCDRSAGDAYSSMTPDPTSDVYRGPCVPILICIFNRTYEIDYCSLFLSFHLLNFVSVNIIIEILSKLKLVKLRLMEEHRCIEM